MLIVPIELPGEMMPLFVTSPVIVPVPPRLPPALTVTVLVRLPFTASRPALTVVVA
jgi:hypothetical protein